MIITGNKRCADANSMEFFEAVMKHHPPPDKLGLAYMLARDDGASKRTLTRQPKRRTTVGSSPALTSWWSVREARHWD
jgi:hypothetical protein